MYTDEELSMIAVAVMIQAHTFKGTSFGKDLLELAEKSLSNMQSRHTIDVIDNVEMAQNMIKEYKA